MKHLWKRSLSLAVAAAMSFAFCTGGLAVHAEETPEDLNGAPAAAAEQGENIFLGKTATASSSQAANPPGNALDGDETGTKWCAAPSSSQQQDPSVGDHWIQIDLGGLYTLDRVYFILEDKNNSIEINGAIYKYQIAVSQSEDVTVDDIVIDRSDNAEMIWTVDEDLGGVVCRYVRIYLNCATPRNWPCIMEAYGYGQPYSAPQEGLALTLDYEGTIQQGDTFQVPLTLGGLEELSDPVYLMQLELTYPDGFSCTGLQPADGIDGAVTYYQAPGETSCTVLYDANSFDTGLPAQVPALFTATFAVAADTAPDTYAIRIGQEPLLISTQGNVLTADLTAASVTVEEKSEPVVNYTVAFETNGGSSVDSQSVAENGVAEKPADPVRDGFTFTGWYTDEACTQAYDFAAAVTSDLTLYAGWQENEPEITYFTVTFETNGGSPVDSQSVAENGVAEKPADPTREGFTFTGWYTDEACTQVYDFASAVTTDLTLYASWQENEPEVTYFTVTFETNGGSSVDSQSVAENGTVSKPADPANGSFTFNGWYIDPACTTLYNFTSPVTGDLTLYAGWKMVGFEGAKPDSGASDTPDVDEPDTDIDDDDTPLNPAPSFTDVPDGHWAKEAIDAVVAQGLFVGTSDTTFSPEMTTTRGMMMTVLARLDGVDTTGSDPWYQKGMEWAVTQGVSDGTNPDALISREQLAVMLYRYAGSPAVSDSDLTFSDASQVSDWAGDGVRWAVANGILSGKGNGILDPLGNATRAEVAQMLYRFVNL